MKETGIVRKLDNLGRLVIPKEIRRCMRIKEGTPIEFGILPDGNIVLSKYSLIGQIGDYSNDFCKILGDIYDCVVLISDRSKIISSYGISKKYVMGKILSNKMQDLLDEKKSYQASIVEGTTIIPLFEDDSNTYTCQLIFPIIIQGDAEGLIILVDSKIGKCFGSNDQMMLKLTSKFLSLQLE